jgi:hypothetical protein
VPLPHSVATTPGGITISQLTQLLSINQSTRSHHVRKLAEWLPWHDRRSIAARASRTRPRGVTGASPVPGRLHLLSPPWPPSAGWRRPPRAAPIISATPVSAAVRHARAGVTVSASYAGISKCPHRTVRRTCTRRAEVSHGSAHLVRDRLSVDVRPAGTGCSPRSTPPVRHHLRSPRRCHPSE